MACSPPPTPCEWTQGSFVVSTDRQRLDVAAIHDFLARRSYWAQGIPIETVRKSIERSRAYGLYERTEAASGERDRQIGFARVITDEATFAYLSDVFIVETHRGRGLSKWLVRTILDDPDLAGLRRWVLVTYDAQTLYEGLGFRALAHPERYMERHFPDVYRRDNGASCSA